MSIRASQVTCLLRGLVVALLTTGAAFANDEVALPAPGQPLATPPVLVRRHGQLHVDLTAAPGEYVIGGERFQGMLYNDSYIPPVWRLKPGDTLTVALYNFHIHQTPFLVTEINGVPQPMLSLFDTITVPSCVGNEPGSVKLKIPFTDPIIVGRFVFHCHVTKHEDKGMMQTIDVEEPRSGEVSSGARP